MKTILKFKWQTNFFTHTDGILTWFLYCECHSYQEIM